MKLFRNIFIHTTVLTTVLIAIALVYFDIVVDFSPLVWKFFKIIVAVLYVAGIGISMAIHLVDLRFAVKRLKQPEGERFSSLDEWREVDARLAKYPYQQAQGTLLFWFASTTLTGIFFYLYKNALSFREAAYIACSGLFMGGIGGGYNYFFFKLDLAPIRRILAPPSPPPDWQPIGSMRRMLSAAFFSICMALIVFPASVLFSRVDKLERDLSWNEGLVALKTLGQVGVKFEGDKLSGETVSVLQGIRAGQSGYVIIWDNSRRVLFGSKDALSNDNWDKMVAEESGQVKDNEKGLTIIFGPMGSSGVKAAAVFKDSDLRSGSIRLLKFMILVVGLSLFMAAGLIALLRRYFGGIIQALVNDVEAVASGNLECRIAVCSDGELGSLEQSVLAMKLKLIGLIDTHRGLVSRISESVSGMVKTASGLREAATEQTASAVEQSSAVQEAISTSEEIVASAAQIAQSAAKVYEVAKQTLDACQEGARSSDVAATGIMRLKDDAGVIAGKMAKLSEAGEAISNITAILIDISDRTQLLALNASLEAAGAGEAGRRFTVVAFEVRRLAERATQAAADISDIIKYFNENIQDSTSAAQSGSKTAGEAVTLIEGVKNSLEKISSFASNTTEASHEISYSTNQQTTASRQMGETISRVNEIAKINEQITNRLEKSAESINDLSTYLMALVEDFPKENQKQ